MANREVRKNIDPKEIDLLLPIDITSFGTDDDPCFGKLHDLKAEECIECGDADFCALVKAQNQHKTRLDVESKQRFKDLEEAEQDMIKLKKEGSELIKEYKDKKYPRMKTVLIISRKLNLSKDIVKQLYDQN